MSTTIRVDLHCHSNWSDGTLKPEAVADRLSSDQVSFAALVDHDSLEGMDAFRKRLARRSIGFITGVEITAQYQGKAAHLLAYGFNPGHAELRANLEAIQHSREAGMESIAGSLHGKRRQAFRMDIPLLPGATSGRIELADGIALIHRAGGLAFLAHPLFLEPHLEKLDLLLPQIKSFGLDGIEALYPAFSPEHQARLVEMARRNNLLVCAGSDFHHSANRTGIEMPIELWQAFRDALLACPRGAFQPADDRSRLTTPRRLNFIVRIVFPAITAMILFGVVMLDIVVPAIEQSLLDRKREMIRELVNSAWGILAEAEQEVLTGIMPLEQAQTLAKKRIETLRYGRDGKDYFWLQDLHPRILMHPYRPELNGQDVSEFRDPRGIRIFVEFANLVRRQDEGFVDYVWQWKDDPFRLVPKESYIRGFKPWGWIIGTGMYIEDVRAEIGRFERHLARLTAGIAILIALLLLYVIRQSLQSERKRREAEESLRESTERYRALVEAATEGTLLTVEGHCRYANPTLLRRLGYSAHDIELLDLADILPHRPDNARAWEIISRIPSGAERPDRIEAVLRSRDGRLWDGLLALSRVALAGHDGLIVQVRDIVPRSTDGGHRATPSLESIHALVDTANNAPLGLLRARAFRQAAILEINRAALELLPVLGAGTADNPPTLASAFASPADFEDFMRRLESNGRTRQRLHRATPNGQRRVLTLDAHLILDETGAPRFIDGCLEDTSADARREADRESLIERLQTSLLYLHEPVERLCHPATFCAPDTPIRQVAALMTAQDSEAALIRPGNGAPIGIVTDRTLRARLIAEGIPSDQPIGRIGRESAVTISRHAQVYEALLLMQEKGIEHLAVTDDESSAIIGLINSRDILHLHSSEAALLTGKIAQAETVAEAIRWCQQAPILIKSLLDSGAHTRPITRLITSICDAATTRFIDLAQREIGPAPVPFVFLALGSQGRQEMTLFADQDNALLFDGPDSASSDASIPRYFGELGGRICTWMDQAGYPFCRGSIMANNPKWCANMAGWKKISADWISRAEPQQLLEFNIFLDFRAVAGQVELARELRIHVHRTLQDHPPFLPLLARDLLRFKPPPNRFIRWLYPPAKREQVTRIDLKEAMLPLVGFSRLYALRHQLDETHTLDRIEALNRRNLIVDADLRQTVVAYDSLMRLRLLHQAECLQENRVLDNIVDWRKLDPVQQSLLRQAFARISAIQKIISYDFLGGT